MIPVYKPFLTSKTLAFAHEAIDSTWISSKGKFIKEIEKTLSSLYSFNDVRLNSAVSVNNGTSALHLISRLLQNKHPKINNIIVPNNVYVAAWNAFLFDSKYTLQAVDASIHTWNYDLEKLYNILKDTNLETTALLAVHNLGNILNVPKLIRDWPGLIIIEDNCEGFLGKYENYFSGSLSFASALSFFGNKNITSGEGGAVITQTENQGYLYKLRSQGQTDKRFIHDELGYNYRMTNIQAAILYGQLNEINNVIQLKDNVFNTYKLLLQDIEEIKVQNTEKHTKHSNWMFGIRIINNKNYENIEKFFNANFIETRPMFYPINYHKHLKNILCDTSTAEVLSRECVILPSFPELQNHEISHIVNTLKLYIKGHL
ncbi:MAG: DegT/DnrJ/EryC1/StrS aminotransferase family protein [Clostridia bacterium]|jgi:perosamine synthetase